MSRGKRRYTPQMAGEMRRSMVQVKIGAKTYDAVYEASCHTCTHPARMLIEEKILQNYSFRAIAELYSEVTIDGEGGIPLTLPKITSTLIYNHFHNGHMPIEAATLRRLAERRAAQIGSQYEQAAEQFVDHMVLAEATVARVYERMVTGAIEPDVKDGIAAAKMISDMEASAHGGIDAEAWSEAMTIYFETAQQFMDPIAWKQFTQALTANPILRAMERRLTQTTVIDAEPLAIKGAS